MGQKVSPHGLRVGVIKTWDSRWFVKEEDIASSLYEDYKIRKFLKQKLSNAGVPRIEIERDSSRIKIHIHCSKPGVVIGKGGTEIEKLKALCEKLFKKNIFINIIEVRTPDINAQLVAEGIAFQLEKRMSFKRAIKQAIGKAMKHGAKGIKVRVAGRLNGAEIARAEHYHEGTIPLQTLRADIDYGFAEANTTYGKIGVKAWIYKGEVLKKSFSTGKSDVGKLKGDSKPVLDEGKKIYSPNKASRANNLRAGSRSYVENKRAVTTRDASFNKEEGGAN